MVGFSVGVEVAEEVSGLGGSQLTAFGCKYSEALTPPVNDAGVSKSQIL